MNNRCANYFAQPSFTGALPGGECGQADQAQTGSENLEESEKSNQTVRCLARPVQTVHFIVQKRVDERLWGWTLHTYSPAFPASPQGCRGETYAKGHVLPNHMITGSLLACRDTDRPWDHSPASITPIRSISWKTRPCFSSWLCFRRRRCFGIRTQAENSSSIFCLLFYLTGSLYALWIVLEDQTVTHIGYLNNSVFQV